MEPSWSWGSVGAPKQSAPQPGQPPPAEPPTVVTADATGEPAAESLGSRVVSWNDQLVTVREYEVSENPTEDDWEDRHHWCCVLQ